MNWQVLLIWSFLPLQAWSHSGSTELTDKTVAMYNSYQSVLRFQEMQGSHISQLMDELWAVTRKKSDSDRLYR